MTLYPILIQFLHTWGGLLVLVLPGLGFLWLHRREETAWQLAKPFVTAIILTAILYRVGLERATFDTWPLLALSAMVTLAVWLCWRNGDMREHTLPVALALAISVVLYRVGCHLGSVPGWPLGGPMLGFAFGMFGFCAFHTVINRSLNDLMGGILVDLIFSDGAFGEKARVSPKLPTLILLRHWREHGMVYKAYRTACRHLSARAETYPLWLFAAETAVLQRHLPVAEGLIQRLCRCAEFTVDQKDFAVRELQRWAAGMDFKVDGRNFEIVREPIPGLTPLTAADQMRAQGRFREAQLKLEQLLKRDPENLAAVLLLARIYCQDQKRRRKAEKLLHRLDGEDFVPDAFMEFARRSLNEWEPLTPGSDAPGDRVPTCDFHSAADTGKNVEELLAEGWLGTALERLESQIETAPNEFDSWLQLLRIYAVHTGSVNKADETYFKILTNAAFTERQKKQAGKLVDQCRRERDGLGFRLN